jgi:5'-nucleotidase
LRILLTNDDGIGAPGLAALQAAVRDWGEAIVVAPASEQSGCSHAATTHRPLNLEQRGEDRYALDGAPADCVRVALHRFGGRFDLVLAGINSGGNLGVDAYLSGTVAAAREALLHGVAAVAVSRYRSRALDAADWERAAEWVRPVLDDLRRRGNGEPALWNVNLPCLPADAAAPGAVECPLDLAPLPLEFRDQEGGLLYCGEYRGRARTPGRDVDVCFGGRIAVTRLLLGG